MLFYTAIGSCHSQWSLMRVHNFADAHYGPVASTCWGLRSQVRAKVTVCVACVRVCVWISLRCISTLFGCCKCDGPQQINQLWGFIRYSTYSIHTERLCWGKKYFHTLDNSGTDTMGTTYGYIWLSQSLLTMLQFILFFFSFSFFFSKHHWFSFDQHFSSDHPPWCICTAGALLVHWFVKTHRICSSLIG